MDHIIISKSYQNRSKHHHNIFDTLLIDITTEKIVRQRQDLCNNRHVIFILQNRAKTDNSSKQQETNYIPKIRQITDKIDDSLLSISIFVYLSIAKQALYIGLHLYIEGPRLTKF